MFFYNDKVVMVTELMAYEDGIVEIFNVSSMC